MFKLGFTVLFVFACNCYASSLSRAKRGDVSSHEGKDLMEAFDEKYEVGFAEDRDVSNGEG